jgi:hypothetical protein
MLKLPKTTVISSNLIPIECALADCRRQSKPNFKATAALYSVNRFTLSRRYDGKQRSYLDSRSESIQRLNSIQERVLLDFINKLTERSLPPTAQIVKNVAQELSNRTVGKNWVSAFVKRH